MVANRGPWLLTATTIFFIWACLAFFVRVWVKLGAKQTWNHADTVVAAAITVAVAHVASIISAISRGYGRPLDEISGASLSSLEKALYVSQLSYVAGVGLTRVSAALFVGHLTRHEPQVRRSHICAIGSGLWTVAAFLIISFRGDLSHPWTALENSQRLYIRWIAVESIGLAVEAALFSLGVALIWGLQMRLLKRLMILSAFGARLLLVPLVALRLYFITPSRDHEPTVTCILGSVFTEGVLELAIIATCITTLKPFLKPFHTGAIVNSVGGSGSGMESGSRSAKHAIYMLGSKNKDKDDNLTTTTTVLSDKDYDDRPRQPRGYGAHPKRDTVKMPYRNHFHPDEVELREAANGWDSMTIRSTTQWAVRYESK